jgi:hypothetical protein
MEQHSLALVVALKNLKGIIVSVALGIMWDMIHPMLKRYVTSHLKKIQRMGLYFLELQEQIQIKTSQNIAS